MIKTLLALALLVCAFGPLPAQQSRRHPAPPPTIVPKPYVEPSKPESQGIYTDSRKVAHKWIVNNQHALIWDGSPYIPVGGAFTPRSFDSADEAAWKADEAALAALKTHDLHDILLWPNKSLPEIPLAAFQRLLDYLETNGFRYGLAFGPGMTTPLTGTVVKPSAYRAVITGDNLTASWQVPDADSGAFILVNVDALDRQDRENDIFKKHSGRVSVNNGLVSVPVDPSLTTGKIVALLYPHRAIPAKGDATLPDLWRGFDDYRDRLIGYLSQVKFGPGLRFFLDPLARHIGMQDECEFLIPDAPNFLLEWEGYLERRYPNVDDIKFGWGLSEGEFKTHREMAQLIPLWANARGVLYFYDIVTNKTYRVMDAGQSHWWDDFAKFRTESVIYYLNMMADVMKTQIADVPVVVTWTQTHPMFRNADPERGFDGIGIVAEAHGSAMVSRSVGPAYSEAEQSARALWCVATELVGTPAPSKPAESGAKTAALAPPESTLTSFGYSSEDILKSDLNRLSQVGIKGFFASSSQPTDAGNPSDWMRAPESLTWLHDYAATVNPASARAAPLILYFPQNSPGPAHIGPVPGWPGVMWLPSFAPGSALDWWPGFQGYALQIGEGDHARLQTVLVSLRGKRLVHLTVLNGDPLTVLAYLPDHTPVKMMHEGKHELIVTLDEKPTIFETGPVQLVPQEAAEDVMVQVNGLVNEATKLHIPEAQPLSSYLDSAKVSYKMKDYERAFLSARDGLDRLIAVVRPYIWLEGEEPLVNTFGEVAVDPQASGGAYLRLSTPNPPGHAGYGARYLFNVPSPGKYNIWLAGSVPGPNTSPIQWRINSDPPLNPISTSAEGVYLDERFGWTLLGTVELSKGDNQSLTVYVTGRAPASGAYTFSLDALLLTKRNFTPNGTVRPLPFDPNSQPKPDFLQQPKNKGGQTH